MTRVDLPTTPHPAVLREVLAALPLDLRVWDHDLHLQYANVSARAAARATLEPGTPLADSLPEGLGVDAEAHVRAALAGQVTRWDGLLDGADAEPVSFAVEAAPVVVDGAVVAVRTLSATLPAADGAQVRAHLRDEQGHRYEGLMTGLQPSFKAVMRRLADLPRTPERRDPDRMRALVEQVNEVIGEVRGVISRLVEVDAGHVDAARIIGAPVTHGEADRRSAVERPTEPAAWQRAVFDSLPALGMWDADCRALAVTPLALWSFGSPEEYLGRTYAELAGAERAAVVAPFVAAGLAGVTTSVPVHLVDVEGVAHVGLVRYGPAVVDEQACAVGLFFELGPAGDARNVTPELRATRQRVAEDLHDHVVQLLYSAALSITNATRGSEDALRAGLNTAVLCVADALVTLHDLVGALHRSGSGDVGAEVRRVARRAAGALESRPRVDLVGDLDALRAPLVEDLLAVLREALSNVARHASARSVHVVLSAQGAELVLQVADDGVGVGRPQRSSGLRNMTARARRHGGSSTVRPNEPRGTLVVWRVPL